jgi:hypothetical protein
MLSGQAPLGHAGFSQRKSPTGNFEQRSEKPLLPSSDLALYGQAEAKRLAISWLYGGGLPQGLRIEIEYKRVVPARGLEPRTLGLKARPEPRRTPPHASCCIRFSASRLPVAPRGTPAWQYEMAIHPKAVSDRSARANIKQKGPLPTSLRRATALRGVKD